jgi:hypothetical protein
MSLGHGVKLGGGQLARWMTGPDQIAELSNQSITQSNAARVFREEMAERVSVVSLGKMEKERAPGNGLELLELLVAQSCQHRPRRSDKQRYVNSIVLGSPEPQEPQAPADTGAERAAGADRTEACPRTFVC